MPTPQDWIIYFLEVPNQKKFRRPKVDNLYDVFVNIRDDECEHVKTMEALQLPEARQTFKSPHTVFELVPIGVEQQD
ncbi:hypothetical protein [Nostoc sp.]|uniref:hypothetical protein n=1 Tax=Nostoc sp. TaxID=1180 RepID=UPI002FFB849A